MNIRETLRDSRKVLESRIATGDELAIFRKMLHDMALSGELAFIGRVVDDLASVYGDALLSQIPDREAFLARGELMGLRAFWTRLLSYGEEPEGDGEPTTEPNIFATLSDLDT